MQSQFILASTSKYRASLLTQLGYEFTQTAPLVDETDVQSSALGVQAKAEKLALLKAQAVLDRFPKAMVLGGDQIAAFGEEALNKPGSEAAAFEQLKKLSGTTHYLYTSIAIVGEHTRQVYTEITRLSMRPLTDAEISEYLRQDQPFDCAGSYKYECNGHKLFAGVDSKDDSAITGLPLQHLKTVLADILV